MRESKNEDNLLVRRVMSYNDVYSEISTTYCTLYFQSYQIIEKQ